MNYEVKENFKGGSGLGAAVAGAGVAALTSGGGSSDSVFDRCPLDDTTFYCRTKRVLGMLQMIVMIILILIAFTFFIHLLYKYLKSMQKSRK
jgi:hypothetical protein